MRYRDVLDKFPVFGREGCALPLGRAVQHTGEIDAEAPLELLWVFGPPEHALDGFAQVTIETAGEGRFGVLVASSVMSRRVRRGCRRRPDDVVRDAGTADSRDRDDLRRAGGHRPRASRDARRASSRARLPRSWCSSAISAARGARRAHRLRGALCSTSRRALPHPPTRDRSVASSAPPFRSSPAARSGECGGDAREAAAACDACATGAFAALVTAPVQKSVMQDAGLAFTGHTEFFAGAHRHAARGDAAGRRRADAPLRVALVTTHLALKDVAAAIDARGVA